MTYSRATLELIRAACRESGLAVVPVGGEAGVPPVGYVAIQHFEAVSNLPPAESLELVRWAAEHGASVAEMLAYGRALRGEDLAAT